MVRIRKRDWEWILLGFCGLCFSFLGLYGVSQDLALFETLDITNRVYSHGIALIGIVAFIVFSVVVFVVGLAGEQYDVPGRKVKD